MAWKHLYKFPKFLIDNLEYAKEIIKKALKKAKNPAVACSFGQDSMLVLHLVKQFRPNIQVIFCDSKTEYPETYKFIREYTKTHKINLYITKPKRNFFWIAKRHGYPLTSRCNMVKYDRKYLPNHYCCKYLKQRPLKQAYKKLKIDYVFDGMRADESYIRARTLFKYGPIHWYKTGNVYRVHPLIWFTYDGVKRTSELLKIPRNPIYTKGNGKMKTRTGCWPCTMAWKYGKGEYLLKYYPKLWKALLKSGFAKELLRRNNIVIDDEKMIEEKLDSNPSFFNNLI